MSERADGCGRRICAAGTGRSREGRHAGGSGDGGDGVRIGAVQVQPAAHPVRDLRQRLLSLLPGVGMFLAIFAVFKLISTIFQLVIETHYSSNGSQRSG